MNIALIGYGKMGHEIEKIALDKGHQIVLKINAENLHELTAENLKNADVAIEFSTPHTVVEHFINTNGANATIFFQLFIW